MAREILFRGFHEDKNGSTTIYVDGRAVKGEWVEGAYSPYDWTIIGERESKPQIIVFAKNENDGLWVDVIPSTVGQYTGLTDENGVKIWEGDICKDSLGWVFEVIWDNENARFLGRQRKPRGDTYICYVSRIPKVEVTGTIWDKECKEGLQQNQNLPPRWEKDLRKPYELSCRRSDCPLARPGQ